MGGARCSHGRDEKSVQILAGKPKGRDHLEDLGVC
jgi:hypothetical protein